MPRDRFDTSRLAQPLELPCGAVLANRIAKAALDEKLADRRQAPTAGMATLYARWAQGGIGLNVSGNVMIDGRALVEGADVVLEDARDLAMYQRLSAAGTASGTHLWMQLNHPGRQAPRYLCALPVAPSDLPALDMVGGIFPRSRELGAAEIDDLVERFGRSAALARRAGYTGVQIHAAHGYLISQFLSPRTNLRTDAWGGTHEKRARFLIEVVRAVRRSVGADFPVGVKLNSADFQRGGFSEEDSANVVRALEQEGVDLLEISGGTYESAAMYGHGAPAQRPSTRAREAYFLEYARKVKALVRIPLMLTGGFRSGAGMAAALAEGAVDVVGLGRPLALEPDLPARLLAGTALESQVRPHRIGHKDLDALAESAWYTHQLHRMAQGLEPDPRFGIWRALLLAGQETIAGFLRPRRWLPALPEARHPTPSLAPSA